MSKDKGSFVCDICKCVLSSKGNFTRHKATNKKCLRLQQKEPERTFKCEYCDFKTTYNSVLTNHEKICKSKIKKQDDELVDLKIQCAVLKKEVEILKHKKPQTININNINLSIAQKIEFSKTILSPYCDILNNIQQLVNTYIEPEKFLKQGYKHIIDVIVNQILKNDDNQYYVSIEPKDSFYRLIDDKIDTDNKANKLIDEIYPYIRKRCNKLKQSYQLSLDEETLSEDKINKEQERTDRLYNEITEIYNTNSPIRKKLIKTIIDSVNVSKESINMIAAQEVEDRATVI